VLGVDAVEPLPDQPMVVVIQAAAQGDLGAGEQHHLGVGAAFRGDEVAAVDYGGGQRTMIDP
jgi:hypothetical protein